MKATNMPDQISGAPAAVGIVADIAAAYDRYHGSGYYARRYPAPNPACLDLLKLLIDEIGGDRVLDFGCGDGRYAAPLLVETSATVLGYDVSPGALEELTHRHPKEVESGRLQLIGGDLETLTRAAGAEPFDLAVAMFGVLAHIPKRAGRQAALQTMRKLLRPGGRLVVTVPNARRRFAAEQAAAQAMINAGELEPGDILYARHADGVDLELYYHLYQPGELEDELRQAGFKPLKAMAESVLPERTVVSWPGMDMLDRALRVLTPRSLAYGFLAVAEPA
jgi:tRNA (uracil-5-)-methyltransferase TRM9